MFEMDLPEIGLAPGVLKPFVAFDPADELESDSSLWTDLQRAVMLREHAWEWLLDDLDANRGQYALLGPERYPVARRRVEREPGPPSRFDKYKPMLPNARSFLYADWLERRIELKFSYLTEEARHIARLPPARVRTLLLRYAARCERGSEETASCCRVRERHRRARRELDHSRSAAAARRAQPAHAPACDLLEPWGRGAGATAADAYSAAAGAARRALRSWRTHEVRVHASERKDDGTAGAF
jgi:hypothetical protein